MTLRPSPQNTRRALLAAGCFGLAVLAACGPPKRRVIEFGTDERFMTDDVRSAKALEAAKAAQRRGPAELPPPTMAPRDVRAALWDIRARQVRGEGGKALDDYYDRADQVKSLEARFLAAAAIPDEDEQWNALKRIADEQPKFYWVHAGIASIYATWKVRDQAEKEVNACFEHGPDVPYTYTIRGNLYRNVGEHNLALRDYDTALRFDPADADARTGRALSRKALGQAKDLNTELERALQDLPTQYEAALELAQLYDSGGNVRAARSAWERVEKLAPKDRGAKLALARLRGDDDLGGAIKAYEEAGKLQPLTKPELESLAKLYRQMGGRSEDETRTLETILKLDTKELGALRRLAELAETSGNIERMETRYKAILNVVEKDAAALYGLARVAESRTNFREAIGLYAAARDAGDVERSSADVGRLLAACFVPEKPLTGRDLTGMYRAVSASLEKVWEKRKADNPALEGSIKMKIENDGEGHATKVDLVDDGLKDPVLEAHLYYVLIQGAWPKLGPKDPRKFSLKFDLPPLKQ